MAMLIPRLLMSYADRYQSRTRQAPSMAICIRLPLEVARFQAPARRDQKAICWIFALPSSKCRPPFGGQEIGIARVVAGEHGAMRVTQTGRAHLAYCRP